MVLIIKRASPCLPDHAVCTMLSRDTFPAILSRYDWRKFKLL